MAVMQGTHMSYGLCQLLCGLNILFSVFSSGFVLSAFNYIVIDGDDGFLPEGMFIVFLRHPGLDERGGFPLPSS